MTTKYLRYDYHFDPRADPAREAERLGELIRSGGLSDADLVAVAEQRRRALVCAEGRKS